MFFVTVLVFLSLYARQTVGLLRLDSNVLEFASSKLEERNKKRRDPSRTSYVHAPLSCCFLARGRIRDRLCDVRVEGQRQQPGFGGFSEQQGKFGLPE